MDTVRFLIRKATPEHCTLCRTRLAANFWFADNMQLLKPMATDGVGPQLADANIRSTVDAARAGRLPFRDIFTPYLSAHGVM